MLGRNVLQLFLVVLASTAFDALSGPTSVSRAADGAPYVIATINVDTEPWGVAVIPNTRLIYVANWITSNVYIIDSRSSTVVGTVAVGSRPEAVAVNAITKRLYVVNYSSNSVSVIDGTSNTVVATVPVGRYPAAVAVNPVTDRVYVANDWSYTLSVIDGDSNIVSATVGGWHRALWCGHRYKLQPCLRLEHE
jgi:YVTN family beta-propeller protein